MLLLVGLSGGVVQVDIMGFQLSGGSVASIMLLILDQSCQLKHMVPH